MYSCNCQNISFSKKIVTILNFRIFAKNGKTNLLLISLTVRDRMFSLKLLTHRVSQETTLCNFQNISSPHKMTAILNFQIFASNTKTQICFYLLNCARYSDFVGIFDSQDISAIYSCQFCPSDRTKLMLPFGWILRMPMHPISS